MDVAISGVAKVHHDYIVLPGDLFHSDNKFGDLHPRYRDIFVDLERTYFHDSGRKGPADFPQPVPLLVSLGLFHIKGSCPRTDVGKFFCLPGDTQFIPVNLDQQQGRGSLGKLFTDGSLDALDGAAVHELQGGWNNTACHDPGYGPGGCGHVRKGGQQGDDSLGFGKQLNEDLGDKSKSSFRTHEEACHIVSGDTLDGLGTGLDYTPIGHDCFQGHDVIPGYPVLDGPGAPGIFRHVTAKSGKVHTGRIGWEEEALVICGLLEITVNDTRLDPGDHIFGIHLDDTVHTAGRDNHASLHSEGTACKTGPTTPRDNGELFLVGKLDDSRDLTSIVRVRNHLGHEPPVHGVVGV